MLMLHRRHQDQTKPLEHRIGWRWLQEPLIQKNCRKVHTATCLLNQHKLCVLAVRFITCVDSQSAIWCHHRLLFDLILLEYRFSWSPDSQPGQGTIILTSCTPVLSDRSSGRYDVRSGSESWSLDNLVPTTRDVGIMLIKSSMIGRPCIYRSMPIANKNRSVQCACLSFVFIWLNSQ